METPVCFSQYFVNKQYVRSLRNILKFNLLKIKDKKVFSEYVLQDDQLVSEISDSLSDLFEKMRNNIIYNSKKDFKNYFMVAYKTIELSSVNKEEVVSGCLKALEDTIPKTLFGGNHNYNLWKKLVHTVVYSIKGQHIFLTKNLKNWDIAVYPWQTLTTEASHKILYKVLFWMIKNLLCTIICLTFYVTTCKSDSDENKLHFFWKSHWQRFYDQKISSMIFTKVICKYEQYCLGKIAKRNHTQQERVKLKMLKKDIPKLYLILKPKNRCRPIVCYKNMLITVTEKYKIKERLNFLKRLLWKPQEKLEKLFNNYYLQWLQKNKPPLYFIKSDLSNAFGSVSRIKLMNIIYERHAEFQTSEKCAHLKKKFAQHYRDTILELRRPFLIRSGSTIYEWKEGLIQGYKYSPALSELYYDYMDKLYFKEELIENTKSLQLFIRIVDDYLFITESLEDANLFINALSKYKNVNYEKTFVNFSHPFIKYNNNITFLGHCYNTETLQISRANKMYSGQMCYKILFSSAIANLKFFLENRVSLSGIQVSNHVFNLQYNSEENIWQNIFITFCLAANKFCTILAILCDQKEMTKYFIVYKKKVTVKLSNVIIETLMKNKPNSVMFMYCINHFRYLSYHALYLCLKQTSQCTSLIKDVKVELAKTNCIFGKWREHACRIDKTGQFFQSLAIKEICRRPDLRMIMKNFNQLPDGFECYNTKSFKL